jgi:hypothetical protein
MLAIVVDWALEMVSTAGDKPTLLAVIVVDAAAPEPLADKPLK